jgi:hypothetical protein
MLILEEDLILEELLFGMIQYPMFEYWAFLLKLSSSNTSSIATITATTIITKLSVTGI